MEMIAMDMKLRGMYMARQLSFSGVSFDIREVPLEDDYKALYDDCVDMVSDHRSSLFHTLLGR